MKVRSESEVAQSCPTLSDPMDCSLPGSSVHGIFQARVLEWGPLLSLLETLGNPQILDQEVISHFLIPETHYLSHDLGIGTLLQDLLAAELNHSHFTLAK